MRIYAGIILIICFVLWTLYRLLIKKDLLKHKDQALVGLFFIGAWALIYKLLLS